MPDINQLLDDLEAYAISYSEYSIPEAKKALKKARKAVIEAFEGEWEYGLRYIPGYSEARNPEDTEMREDRARAVVETYPDDYKLLRRRKAGPWEITE